MLYIMDDDAWDKKYIFATLKGFLVSFFLNILFFLSIFVYYYFKFQIFFNFSKFNSIWFYLNDMLFTLILITYFLYKAKSEEI